MFSGAVLGMGAICSVKVNTEILESLAAVRAACSAIARVSLHLLSESYMLPLVSINSTNRGRSVGKVTPTGDISYAAFCLKKKNLRARHHSHGQQFQDSLRRTHHPMRWREHSD